MDLFYGTMISLHLGLQLAYNPVHPYVGAYLNDNVSMGAYYNSEENLSAFVGYTYRFNDDISVETGLVTGYTYNEISPMVKLNYKNVFIAPAVEIIRKGNTEEKNIGVVLGLEWRK